MTMVTASTALTIFIMNIHHCGSEALPVPPWAKRFILNYLARICFVYEVGENCLSGALSRKQALSQDESEAQAVGCDQLKEANRGLNGGAWSQQAGWKEDVIVGMEPSDEDGAAGGVAEHRPASGRAEADERGEEKKGVRGEEGSGANRREVLLRTLCVCQHLGLRENIEYIASSYQDQRAAQLRIGEWRKVAKVMDRFFMWLFFIMVLVMSILILGKAI